MQEKNTNTAADSPEEPIHPLKRLKQEAEKRLRRQEQERVHCPDCGTTIWKDSIEAAIETAENHDEKRHDGEQTTTINGVPVPSGNLRAKVEDAAPEIGLTDPEGSNDDRR